MRYRAKIELSGRDSDEVIAGRRPLDRSGSTRTIRTTSTTCSKPCGSTSTTTWSIRRCWSACWPRPIFTPAPRPRACSAIGAIAFPIALDLLKRLAADAHPRVRLEAVRAASFFTAPEAVEIAVIAAEQPTDEYLDFVRGETLRTLDPYWKKALAANRPVAFTTDAGARYLLQHISNEQLLKRDRSRAVCLEMLDRPGLLDEDRREAVRRLAELDNKTELTVIIETIHALDAEAGQGRRERRLRPGAPAHRPQRRPNWPPPGPSWKSWPRRPGSRSCGRSALSR